MPVVLVANPKGGVGKSTIATNLAGYFANQGYAVMLGDTDTQQSAQSWLQRRPSQCPQITTWEIDPDLVARPPAGISHIVLDTPAGIAPRRLKLLLKIADYVLVPIQPSLFDMLATQSFIDLLKEENHAFGLIGMRVDARTKSAEQLQRFISDQHLPLLTCLRDTQNYIQLAAHGLTLFDVAPSRVEKDRQQWLPVTDWLNQ